jgi:hypothetical protein
MMKLASNNSKMAAAAIKTPKTTVMRWILVFLFFGNTAVM